MAAIGGGLTAIAVVVLMLVVGVVALLVAGLSPRSRWVANQGRRDHDIAIARAQLSELHSDRQRGLIGDDEYQAARLEIERRLLSADQDHQPDIPHPDHRQRRWTAIVLIAVIPLAVAGVYLALGAPGLPGLAYAERVELLAQGRRALAEGETPTRGQLDALIADLAVRLAAGGGDAETWGFLARGYRSLGNPLAALSTLEEGLARFPENQSLQADYVAMLIAVNDTAARLDALFAADGGDGFLLWRQGLVATGLGQQQAAAEYWGRLLATLPTEDKDRRQALEQALAALQKANAGEN